MAEAWVEDDVLWFDALVFGVGDSFGEKGGDGLDDVFVLFGVDGGLFGVFGIHEDDFAIGFGGEGGHFAVGAEGGDIVDDGGAGLEGFLCDLCVRCVD